MLSSYYPYLIISIFISFLKLTQFDFIYSDADAPGGAPVMQQSMVQFLKTNNLLHYCCSHNTSLIHALFILGEQTCYSRCHARLTCLEQQKCLNSRIHATCYHFGSLHVFEGKKRIHRQPPLTKNQNPLQGFTPTFQSQETRKTLIILFIKS